MAVDGRPILLIVKGKIAMNVGMGMNIESIIVEAVRCGICGSLDHTPECPLGILEGISSRQRQISCPKCGGMIEINANDEYECRKCHTRFTCGDWSDSENPETVYLDDHIKDEFVKVNVLVAMGKGDFPIDRQIESAQKAVKEAQRKLRRRKKK